jgi:small GTP-binding protein
LRRFIPLRLDDAPIPGSLGQFKYINWAEDDREQEYAAVLEACGSATTKEQASDEEAKRELVLAKIMSLGHTGTIFSVAVSPDGRRALSGSDDQTVRVWDVASGRCERVLEGHTGSVRSVAWNGEGRALSGSDDQTVRVWDAASGRCERVLEGHTGSVWSVAWSGEGRALSGSDDQTVRVWDVASGRCERVLEGHTGSVWSVAWSGEGRARSGSYNGVMRVWDLSAPMIEPLKPSVGVVVAPDLVEPETQLQYTNAKVLLVGDSGVGKSGLANQLALGIPVEDDKPLASTDGAWASQWKLEHASTQEGVEQEIWLWDFAGQVDYRLVHQLFMDDTAAAVLVFDPQKENPYEGLGQWDRDLQKAARKPFAKLLAAGRIDRGGLIVSDASIEKFRSERGFHAPLLKTSAKTGEGCDALREAIVEAIDWDAIPITTSLTLYHRMKEEILRLRDSGIVLMRLVELKQRMELALGGGSLYAG